MNRLAFGLALLLPLLARAGGAVVIESIEGEGSPKVSRQGRILIAQEGDELVESDAIVVGAGAAARLLYPDGSQLLLGENSELEIQRPEAGAPAVGLKKGGLTAKIEKQVGGAAPTHKFFVRTSAAVMGVRGTEFVLDHDETTGRTDLRTLEGEVEIGRSGDELAGGRGRRIRAGEMLRAERAALGQVERFDREAFLRQRRDGRRAVDRLAARPPRSRDELRARRGEGGPGLRERGRESVREQLREELRRGDEKRERERGERRRPPEDGKRRLRD